MPNRDERLTACKETLAKPACRPRDLWPVDAYRPALAGPPIVDSTREGLRVLEWGSGPSVCRPGFYLSEGADQ